MKVSVPVDIDAIVKQLPLREKIRLARRLEKETWASELDAVVGRIRNRSAIRRLSTRDVHEIVESVRKERCASGSRRP